MTNQYNQTVFINEVTRNYSRSQIVKLTINHRSSIRLYLAHNKIKAKSTHILVIHHSSFSVLVSGPSNQKGYHQASKILVQPIQAIQATEETSIECISTEGYRVERNSVSELTGEAKAEAIAKARASFACRFLYFSNPRQHELIEYPYRYSIAVPLASYFEVEPPPSSASQRSPVRSDAIGS
ncbi:hypothetical protein WN51_08731 [Melipona quadrifasciata]|uniref:Uncharacterized protein n=1 Tax=Melipona quadrifasciata TaxID=166423 RepID=A0A0M8ZQ77_9HYME|nr:hypothetical protein WN51_08731 [Melipona quadrifasciata]